MVSTLLGFTLFALIGSKPSAGIALVQHSHKRLANNMVPDETPLGNNEMEQGVSSTVPSYVTRTCQSIFLPSTAFLEGDVQRWLPHPKGGEIHSDLRIELQSMQPSFAREILELASPRSGDMHLLREAESYEGDAGLPSKEGSACTVKRFVQYAYCEELGGAWARNWTALSFGGNGYDDWSNFIKPRLNVTPQLFDCFDPRPVTGAIMRTACIGGQIQRAREKGKHTFLDLDTELSNLPRRSVLMKLDIEGSEFDVLRELPDSSLRKIAYLTVEYHFLGGDRCCDLGKVKELFQRLANEFLIIDGAAMRWGKETDCKIEGNFNWPNALSVSYIARDLIQSSP